MSSPKKNTAYVFYISLIDTADTGAFKANPTIAAGDFQVSGDDAAFADLATLPVVAPSGSIGVKISLSQAEMNFDKIMVQCIDAAGSEWDDVLIFIDATAANVDDIVRSTTPANTLDVTATGAAGVNWGNVENQGSSVNLSSTTTNLCNTITTYTGNTLQTADVAVLAAKFAGMTSLPEWLGLLAGKQSEDPTASAEINATGVGSGNYTSTTDSLEAIRDGGDAAWLTATGFSTHNAAAVWSVATRVLTANTNLNDVSTSDLATALSNIHLDHLFAVAQGDTAVDDCYWANLISATGDASTFTAADESLEALRSRGDAAWITGNTTSPPSAATIAAAVWDAVQSSHVTVGSFGIIASEIATILTFANASTPQTADHTAGIADIPTVSEFNARTLVAASYFDPTADTVANVTTVGSVTTKTGYSLVATGLDLVLVDGRTLPNALEIIGALTAGKISGAGLGTEIFVGLDLSTTRATVTVDSSGNRTAVVYV